MDASDSLHGAQRWPGGRATQAGTGLTRIVESRVPVARSRSALLQPMSHHVLVTANEYSQPATALVGKLIPGEPDTEVDFGARN